MINSEMTLVGYPVRMTISIPGSGSAPQTIRQLIDQTNSFFNKRPDLLKRVVAITILNQSADFLAGTIDNAGTGWEADTTQITHAASDTIPYSEPFVVSSGMDIEALRAVGAGAVTAVAVIYMSDKDVNSLPHSTVEVPA